MLSIGRLGRAAAAADYYLRRQAGCDLDYYTGRGERAGQWCGAGAAALGLTGELTLDGQQRLAQLLAGLDVDGTRLVPGVFRAAPGSRLPAGEVLDVLDGAATARGLQPDQLFVDPKGLGLFRRVAGCVADSLGNGRPTEVRAELAGRILTAAGLDPTVELRGADGTDRYGQALALEGERVDVRRPGLDLTFSAPKSVSVLYALGSAEVAGQVRAAHDEAVRQAYAYMESRAAVGRRGAQGVTRVGTDGLMGVAFEHRTSRCHDPQLHTHVVTANLARGEDGKWGAIDTTTIYREAKTVGYIYQAILRGELTARLGVGWGPVTNGTAEIRGIPTGLLRLFSQRRAAITAAMAQLGRSGPRAAQHATLTTRPRKTEAGSGLWDGWRERVADAGFPLDPDRLLGHHHCPELPEADRLAADLVAPSGLTHARSTFTRGDLLQAVCTAIPVGTQVNINALRALATEVMRHRDIVPLLPLVPSEDLAERRYSTSELLTVEQRVLTAAGHGGPKAGAVPPGIIRRSLAAARLSEEQRAAVTALTSRRDQVAVLIGPAGAGKTAALSAARAAWEHAVYPVLGAAVAAIAARNLHAGSGITSTSITRLLADISRPDATTGLPVGLPDRCVLVVDEASMVGTRTLDQLITATTACRGKLVLVGDPRQLPEIDAGGLFAALADRPDTIHLTENHRQPDQWEQHALRQLRAGDVAAALDAYDVHKRLHLSGSVNDTVREIVATYLSETERGGDVIILGSRRSDVRLLNETIRTRLLDSGQLGDTALRAKPDGPEFRAGDRVVFTANDYAQGLFNGTRGHITAINTSQKTARSRADDGREHTLPTAQLADLDHGYAMTCHRAQGLTVDVALLYGTAALYREAGYVGLSRGRRANHLYTSHESITHAIDDDLHHADSTGQASPDPSDLRAQLLSMLTLQGAQLTALQHRSRQFAARQTAARAHQQHESAVRAAASGR